MQLVHNHTHRHPAPVVDTTAAGAVEHNRATFLPAEVTGSPKQATDSHREAMVKGMGKSSSTPTTLKEKRRKTASFHECSCSTITP